SPLSVARSASLSRLNSGRPATRTASVSAFIATSRPMPRPVPPAPRGAAGRGRDYHPAAPTARVQPPRPGPEGGCGNGRPRTKAEAEGPRARWVDPRPSGPAHGVPGSVVLDLRVRIHPWPSALSAADSKIQRTRDHSAVRGQPRDGLGREDGVVGV